MSDVALSAGDAKDADADFLNKFSRQNAAFGAEVTLKMTKMKALVVGCSGGIAIEVVKNLVLQGLGGATLCDTKLVQMGDVAMNFFLQEADIGKPVAQTLAPRCKELNPFCDIKAADALTPELVAEHAVMLVCEQMSLPELLRWNIFCRTATPKPIAFIYAHTGGVFASVFTDFGSSHVINDANGQAPMVRLVESIESGTEALVRLTVPDGQAPGTLPEGSYVEFSDVVGCDGVMTHQEASPCGEQVTAWKISSKGSDPVNTIRIGDTTGFPPHIRGGMVTEKKVGSPYPFRSLAEAIKDPGMPFDNMVGTDMINFGSEYQMHLALHAALAVEAERGGPLAVGDTDIATVIAKAKDLLKAGTTALDIEVDEDMFTKLVRHFRLPLQPLCAFIGGVVAQEIVKMAGKYTPIPGFLHFHAMEALPDEVPADTTPTGDRYDNLSRVFGAGFVKKLNNLKYFMVGCGALGCEFLKNFALNGVCCGNDGLLTVTDADRIELSNLTRQFLFREHNVGQPKSKAACAMATEMNPGMKVRPLEMFVGPKTEDTFDDGFWLGLDGVCNALDNMEARFYVDDQCVKYERSLLESGTMGPAGNIDPVVPFKTQTYRDGGQADEGGGIPMCTLRNFPHLPDHCMEWARDQFELLFVKSAKQVKKFYEDPSGFIEDRSSSTDDAQSIFEIRGLLSLLTAAANPSVKSAGQMAFDYFHMLFRDKITDLTNAFPEDVRVVDPETKQDKGPFWSGHKRFPKAATFDPSNETHWRFQVATTALFAAMLGVVPAKKENEVGYLKEWRDQSWVAKAVSELTVPEYIAGGVNTEGDDAAASAGSKEQNSKDVLKDLISRLEAFREKKIPPLEEADFEKDDDDNFHIDFITRCANLRADNYQIANSDFHKVKLVAGRIVPAIATTTAAVCGLVMLELFKLVQAKGAGSLRTRQIGLAMNTYTSFEANEPKFFVSGEEKVVPKAEDLPEDAFDEKGIMKPEFIVKEPYSAYPEKHSVWDKLKVPSGSMTLDNFQAWLRDEHKLNITSWAFVLGWKQSEDENGKEMKVPSSTQVYPPPVVINTALLPSLDGNQADVMKEIMQSKEIPQAQKMRYFTEWKEAKKTGAFSKADSDVVTSSMTLRDILLLMEKKAEAALSSGAIAAKWGKAISGLAGRKFWVVPADQTPSCTVTPSEGAAPVDVRFMARLEIPLE